MATLLPGCKPRIPQTLQSLTGAPLRRSQNKKLWIAVFKKVTFKGFFFMFIKTLWEHIVGHRCTRHM